MYDFVRGPLVWVAFIVFFGGLALQVFRFFALTRRKEPHYLPANLQPSESSPSRSKTDWPEFLRSTILGTHPVMTIVTYLFHVCLFLVPILLLAHSILFYESWGLSTWTFSESTTNILTLVFLACCAFFLLRRLIIRKVRALTTAYDYLILAIVVAPFLSGFLAYQQWFDYRTMLIAHILAGEVMLIVMPFTKLGHMLFFFLYRFLVGGEYSFGQGTRTW
jgi:nitrate reductase gamma subunit